MRKHKTCKRFGILFDNRTGNRHRRHSACKRKRCQHNRLVAFRHADNAFHHRNIETERRIGIDDREDRGFAIKRGIINTARDAHEFNRIEIAFRAERVSMDRLIGNCQHIVERIKMAHGSVNIRRLHRIAAPEMNGIQ